VTTFRRSNTLYSRAMSYNKELDRDKDGIACEKKWRARRFASSVPGR